ncbi:MAG: DNA-binding protein [Dokdonella sp.]
MSNKATPLTPAQVRERMRQSGTTLTQWATDHGFNRDAVYRVMGGQYKAYWGRSHDIAVALGLKVPGAKPSTPTEVRNPQSRQVA